MATRFTRVTVVADGRQLDVSLPASRPVLEVLPQLCDLLSLPPVENGANGAWALSTVAGGMIDSRRTLDDAGILDADVLYLTPPKQAQPPPFVDDVVDEVRTTLDGDNSEWADTARVVGSCAAAGVAVLGLAVVGLLAPGRPGGAVALVVVAALLAAGLGRLFRGRGGVLIIGAGLPAWALTGAGLAGLGEWGGQAEGYAALTGLGLGAVTFAWAGQRWYAPAAAGAVVSPLAAFGVLLATAGLSPATVAAVLTVLVLFAIGLAPQLALGRSGLVDLVRGQERAEPVARERVAAAVDAGQAALAGAVCGAALVGAVTTTVLFAARTAPALALGGLATIIYALRSRAFSRTSQVLPLLGAATVGAAAAAILLPRWLILASVWPYVSAAALLALLGLLLIAGRTQLDEVAAARMRQIFDAVEAVAVIVVVPLVIAVFGGYEWARNLA